MNVGLSLVICTYNGIKRLKTVLDHLTKLDIPKELIWEVLVIDNASTDDTSNWVAEIQSSKTYSLPISLYYEPCPGLNNARITGAKMAIHDWLLFCDDDNLLEKNFIRFWFNVILEHNNLGAVGGRGIPLFDNDLPDWFKQYGHSYAVGPQMNQSGFVPIGGALYGAGLFVFKKPILKILENGFEMIMSDRKSGKLTSGGDLEWCYLIQLSGLRMYYEDKMIFHHQLNANRLQWSYYIKLKSSIAGGVGLLQSYHFIFSHGYRRPILFLINYIGNSIKMFFILISVNLKSILFTKDKSSSQQKLALVILRAKFLSYIFNAQTAYLHYKKLNQLFNASV